MTVFFFLLEKLVNMKNVFPVWMPKAFITTALLKNIWSTALKRRRYSVHDIVKA